MKKKKTKCNLLHLLAVVVILLAGVYLGYHLRGQTLPTTPAEQAVVRLRLNQAIEKRAELLNGVTVQLSQNEDLGDFLAAGNGMTLYRFANDEEGKSHCYDACAVNWPPLMAAGALKAGEGVIGSLGSFQRDDGSMQVTYNGQPLYFWVNDELPGDTTGHGVNDAWFAVQP